MLSFAVTHDGLPVQPDGNVMALWVLAVVGEPGKERFLLCGPGGFYTRFAEECKMARLHGPDNATLVADVADMQQRTAGIVLPSNGKGF